MYRIAILFILLGFAVKYGRMYFLVSGYNTMSPKGKARVDINGIATLLCTIMFIMAGLILMASLAAYCFKMPKIEGYVFFPTLAIGILWLIVRSNAKKYRLNG